MKTKNTDGLKKIIQKRFDDNTEKHIKRRLETASLLVEGTAKENIQRGAKTGTVYKRRGVTHQASAKGEYPATDTGFLVANIGHTTVKHEGTKYVAKVFSGAPYSKFLEFGTRKMGERPFLQPSLERNAEKIEVLFKKGGFLK